MHDGAVRALTDVRSIPDLKKKLISLGTLESKGFKVTMEGGVLKVVLDALVVLKGTRKKILYFLDENAITGSAAVSDSSEDSMPNPSNL